VTPRPARRSGSDKNSLSMQDIFDLRHPLPVPIAPRLGIDPVECGA
jgi:hypothetical protein